MAAVGEEAEQEVIKGSMMDQLNSSHVAAEMGAAARVAADITVKVNTPEEDALLTRLQSELHSDRSKTEPKTKEQRVREQQWLVAQKEEYRHQMEEERAERAQYALSVSSLTTRRTAKKCGRRWITFARVRRREKEAAIQRENARGLSERVQQAWRQFQHQHALNLYSTMLLPRPTPEQVEAAWTSGDSNANGDYGGRNDSQPTAADVDTLDFSTKVAAIGLSESSPSGKPREVLREKVRADTDRGTSPKRRPI